MEINDGTAPAGLSAACTRDVVPLIALPAIALLVRPHAPGWIFMWSMAAAIFAGCKWLTYRDAVMHGAPDDRRRALGYLLAWPGMDAAAFLSPPAPRRATWMIDGAAAILTIGLGVVLIRVAAPAALGVHPIAAGWFVMAGVVLVLHFGVFALLSAAWRAAGVDARPVMQRPLRSVSLAEFWGRRWNTAFHDIVVRFTFRPLRRVAGGTAATVLVFLVSGLVHELVISVPAGAGYGLPTGYFLVQSFGVVIERSRRGRRLGLGRGWRGRVFTLAVTAVPAFWLFSPAFVRGVVLPMLAAISRLP